MDPSHILPSAGRPGHRQDKLTQRLGRPGQRMTVFSEQQPQRATASALHALACAYAAPAHPLPRPARGQASSSPLTRVFFSMLVVGEPSLLHPLPCYVHHIVTMCIVTTPGTRLIIGSAQSSYSAPADTEHCHSCHPSHPRSRPHCCSSRFQRRMQTADNNLLSPQVISSHPVTFSHQCIIY